MTPGSNDWDEVLEDCLDPPGPRFCRLTGSIEAIRSLLNDAGPRARLIISYDQLRTAGRLVANYLLQNPTHLVHDPAQAVQRGGGVPR